MTALVLSQHAFLWQKIIPSSYQHPSTFFSLSISLFDDNSGQGCASAARPWFISSCATSSVRKLSTRMINVWVNFPKSYIGNWMHFCSIKSFWNLKDSHIDIAIDQRFEAFLVKVGRCWEAISHHMLCVCESHLAAFLCSCPMGRQKKKKKKASSTASSQLASASGLGRVALKRPSWRPLLLFGPLEKMQRLGQLGPSVGQWPHRASSSSAC